MNLKSLYILFVSLTFAFSLHAVSPDDALDSFLQTSGVEKSSVAVSITSLNDSKTIVSHNSSTPLIPASIMKSVTIASLLPKTGVDFRFMTPIYVDGPVEMNSLHGNLIIEGNGDPSLHSCEAPGSTDIFDEIVKALKAQDISRIEGRIVIDESAFSGSSRPSSWMAADFPHSYGTGFHGLNFEDNAKGQRSVDNPKSVFLAKLKAKLAEENIILEDNKNLGDGIRKEIFTHLSSPMDEIMRSCMMRSDNLYAESFLRTFGRLSGGDGSVTDSAVKEFSMWKEKGFPLDNVKIIDGSGLSRLNRVTADFMTSVLSAYGDDQNYASFFPLAGQDGTLAKFLKDTELDSYIAMKTGSMKGIQCYAGYKLDEEYSPTHTVVIIMNDITGSRDKAKKAAERLILDIFSN